jgi:hypothetical protein
MQSTATKLCQGLRNIKGKDAHIKVEEFNKPCKAQFMFWRVRTDSIQAVMVLEGKP